MDSKLAILLSSSVNLIDKEPDRSLIDDENEPDRSLIDDENEPDRSLIDEENEPDRSLIDEENEAEYCSAFSAYDEDKA